MIFFRRPDPAGVPTSAADSDPGTGGGRGIPQAVSQEEGSPGYHESYYLNQVISFLTSKIHANPINRSC